MYRYAIYARKSHDDRKVTEKSIGEQIEEVRKLDLPDGSTVLEPIEESKSAKIPRKRPLYSELISRVEAGEVDALLCWHVNRLVRNMEEGGKLVQLLIDGQLKEIRTPHALYRSGENILAVVIEAASATQSSIDLVHVVNRSSEGKFRAGGSNHQVPQGYRNARDPMNLKRGIVVCDEMRFSLIRKVCDLVLTGTVNVAEALDTLNVAWGYRTKITEKQGGGPLSYSCLYDLLHNPFYAGFVRRNGELVRGTHKPMLSVQEFERIQELLGRQARRKRQTYEHTYTGLMHCAYCGLQVTAESRKTTAGNDWEGYRCTNPRHTCVSRGIRAEAVEKIIASILSSIEIDDDAYEVAWQYFDRALLQSDSARTELTNQQERALADAHARLAKLADMWIGGLITDRARYAELEQRELATRNRILRDSEKTRTELAHMRANGYASLRFARIAPHTFTVALRAHRRALAQALGTQFTFYGVDKKIDVEVNSLLTEVVKFAKETAKAFESTTSGSQGKKPGPFKGQLHFGGGNEKQIELPESLITALKGPAFPDLFDERGELR